jgi:hypothetical protein
MSSPHRSPGARQHAPDQVLGDPLDGRLDLDDLDAPLDLESIGDDHDHPYLSERLRGWLEEKGVIAWVRRHRVPLAGACALVVAAVAVAGVSYARRPVPLPEQPRLVLTSSGADADQVQVDTSGDEPVLSLSMVLTSAEARGVRMTLLGLLGPGLVENPRAIPEEVDPAEPDRVLRTSALLRCGTPELLAAVLSATPQAYAVSVRRTSAEGATRVDAVPLRGGSRLHAVILQQCVQARADVELDVTGVRLAPLTDAVGLSMDITVEAIGGNAWNFERVVSTPASAITSDAGPTYASPDTPARLQADLYPTDCAHPLRDVAGGIAVQAAPAGASVDGAAGTQVMLPLPSTVRTSIVQLLSVQCGDRPVTATIDQVITHAGGGADSAGTLELRMHLQAPGAFVVPIEDTTTDAGRLRPDESPVHPVDGVATAVVTWKVPPCSRLAVTRVPKLVVSAVVLSGDSAIQRPYLVELVGDNMRVGITRLCGDDVAKEALITAQRPTAVAP